MLLLTKERYNLPKDYFVQVNQKITFCTLLTMWGLLPMLAFCPNSLDMVINDTVGDWIEQNRFVLIKLFNVQVWVRLSYWYFLEIHGILVILCFFFFFQLHMIECIVAIQLCRRYAIGPLTTLKWIGSVAIHGILALKHLLWPSEDVEKIKIH